MDKDNVVVGYVVPLLKSGQRKDVVVPASPELSVKVEEIKKKGTNPWARPIASSPVSEPSPSASEGSDKTS